MPPKTDPLVASIAADDDAYRAWRERKLARFSATPWDSPVVIGSPHRLTDTEREALAVRFEAANFAVFRIDRTDRFGQDNFLALCAAAGLHRIVHNPYSGPNGITELTAVGDNGARSLYIPYTRRSLNWHTDGYYNDDAKAIRSFAMYCVEPAPRGGENRYLDPELLYLHLRDHQPDLLETLFRPDAFTIPPGTSADGGTRAAFTGPVFAFDPDGRLHTRFTLRKRHIEWHEAVREAKACIASLLADPTGFGVVSRKLAAGEGVLANNVLHHRAAYEDGAGADRLLWRARFGDVVRVVDAPQVP